MADRNDPKRGFWKRMAAKVPGSIKAVPNGERNRGLSFSDFDNEVSDAWSEGEDDFFKPGGRADSKAADISTQSSSAAAPKQAASAVSTTTTSGPAKPDVTASDAPGERTPVPSPSRPSAPPATPGTPATPASRAPQTPPTNDPGLVEKHADASRLEKFQKLLASSNLDLGALRELSWAGIPHDVRPTTWRLLSGYLPANIERRETTLNRKRKEYAGFVDQYYHTRNDEANQKTFHQIHIDVPRTSPSVPIFQQASVQEMFERILYIWAIRHPGSGYVQGINDLVTPFFAVFLQEHIDCPLLECEVASVAEETRASIEADTFWCMTKLLDGIQDNYTFAQPGIQKKLRALKELVMRIDGPLHQHLENNCVEYLQFAFRWMNCLLMREMPLNPIIRLWDTYHAEPDGFATFHLYVCAAFLVTFSKQLREMQDFQQILQSLQNLPTQDWDDKNIKLLLAEAYHLKYVFHDAQKHLL